MKEEVLAFALLQQKNIGLQKTRQILQKRKQLQKDKGLSKEEEISPEQLVLSPSLQQILFRLYEEEDLWMKKLNQEQYLYYEQAEYPYLLKQIYQPPLFLFYEGKIELLKRPCLAIIGSRNACTEAKIQLQKIIPLLSQHYVIVSGLARGIDSLGHQACLHYGGQTIAVLGNGTYYFYPKENRALQLYLGQHQLLLSEYPKFTPPKRYYFPQRNRIIAGLSQGICVLQAGKQSGTFITAHLALDEGRDVFVFPGSSLKGEYEGCYQLIAEGAEIVWQAEQILASLAHWK